MYSGPTARTGEGLFTLLARRPRVGPTHLEKVDESHHGRCDPFGLNFDPFHVERLAANPVDEGRRAKQRRVGAKAASTFAWL